MYRVIWGVGAYVTGILENQLEKRVDSETEIAQGRYAGSNI